MRIVQLTSADVDRFCVVRREGLRNDPGGFRYSEAEDLVISAAVWAARLDRDYVIAAEGDGEILGIGGLARFAEEKLAHKALIWGMYVRAPHRGTGVSNAIMEALIAHARADVRQLQLTVMADNSRARAFYERHGFSVYAVEPEAVRQGDDFRDEASMWLRLSDDRG
jgi:RimJ/RimL family protein N-acetyltransferase